MSKYKHPFPAVGAHINHSFALKQQHMVTVCLMSVRVINCEAMLHVPLNLLPQDQQEFLSAETHRVA